MKIFCKSVSDGLRRRVGGRRIFPCVRVVVSFSGLRVSGERAVCRSVSNGADEARTAVFSRKGRARRRPFPSEGQRGVGRFGRMRSAGAPAVREGRRLGAGGDTDRSEKRCCVQPLRPAGKVGARRTVLPVCGAGPGIRTSFRFAGRGRREKYGFASCYAPERNAGTRCRRKRALS